MTEVYTKLCQKLKKKNHFKNRPDSTLQMTYHTLSASWIANAKVMTQMLKPAKVVLGCHTEFNAWPEQSLGFVDLCGFIAPQNFLFIMLIMNHASTSGKVINCPHNIFNFEAPQAKSASFTTLDCWVNVIQVCKRCV